MSMHELMAGDGYAYLTRHVACLGDATRRLHPGDVVSQRAMTALFRDGRDSLTDDVQGRGYSRGDDGRRRAVVGYDLTFTAPKFASVLWALAHDVTCVIGHDAHRAALASSLRFFQQRVITTCIGDAGRLPGQEPTSSREVLERGLATSHAEPTATETRETYAQQPVPVIRPVHPHQPWGRPAPQLSAYRLNSAPSPLLDGPDPSL